MVWSVPHLLYMTGHQYFVCGLGLENISLVYFKTLFDPDLFSCFSVFLSESSFILLAEDFSLLLMFEFKKVPMTS